MHTNRGWTPQTSSLTARVVVKFGVLGVGFERSLLGVCAWVRYGEGGSRGGVVAVFDCAFTNESAFFSGAAATRDFAVVPQALRSDSEG